MKRRPILAAPILFAALAAATACGDKDKPANPTNSAPATTATGPGTTTAAGPGTTTAATGATAAADCPDETVLTATTKAGTKELVAKSAYADVTLDSSVTVLLTNYEIAGDDLPTIYQPSLTGDQLGLSFTATATKDTKLTPGTYLRPGTSGEGTYQFNTYSLYSADGREMATGFDLDEPVLVITVIDSEKVCGEITTPEASGRFQAKRV